MALTVLARAPEPGLVKTRLAAAIGAVAACEIHAALASDTLAALGPARLVLAPSRHGTPAGAHVLALTGSMEAGETLARPAREAGWRVEDQGTGDLGARMALAVGRRLAEGFDGVLLTGTDAPLVDAPLALRAGAELEAADVVLAPAGDGGFVLLGARREVGAALRGISWGTPEALSATLAGLGREGLSARLTEGEADVDDLDGLLRLERRLLSRPGAAPATAAWLREARAADDAAGGVVAEGRRGPLPPLR